MIDKGITTKEELTCQHCGHKGLDVHYEFAHVGGVGDVRVTKCDDNDACWDRWEKQQEAKNESRR